MDVRVRAGNYIKFETRRNLPLVPKIVTCPARTLPLCIVAKHARDRVFYFYTVQ